MIRNLTPGRYVFAAYEGKVRQTRILSVQTSLTHNDPHSLDAITVTMEAPGYLGYTFSRTPRVLFATARAAQAFISRVYA